MSSTVTDNSLSESYCETMSEFTIDSLIVLKIVPKMDNTKLSYLTVRLLNEMGLAQKNNRKAGNEQLKFLPFFVLVRKPIITSVIYQIIYLEGHFIYLAEGVVCYW